MSASPDYFQLLRQYTAEALAGGSCPGLYGDPESKENILVAFKTGEAMTSDFSGTLKCIFDPEEPTTPLPTFFMSPAWITTRAFSEFLRSLNVTDFEVFPVEIRNTLTGQTHRDYVLLNVTKSISCAHLQASQTRSLGGDLVVVDRLVIDDALVENQSPDIFVAAEDTDIIVVHERIQEALIEKGFPDIAFQKLEKKSSHIR
ncbi:MAG: DUF1629 domain-containing protein [Bdellovibrio sp.]